MFAANGLKQRGELRGIIFQVARRAAFVFGKSPFSRAKVKMGAVAIGFYIHNVGQGHYSNALAIANGNACLQLRDGLFFFALSFWSVRHGLVVLRMLKYNIIV